MKYRAAIIGCGNIAGGYDRQIPKEWAFTHAGAYHLCEQTDLVAVHDVDPAAMERFRQKWGPVACYRDIREMIAKEQPHIVSICSPTETHAKVFQTICEQDVPAIFCEKPLSYHLQDALKMPDIAVGRTVAVNYFRRWNVTFQNLKTKIDARQYGEPVKIVAYYTKGFVHNASHLIDQLIWFFGPVQKARVMKIWWKDPNDAGIDFELEFASSPTAHIFHMKGLEYNFFEADLFFSKGRVLLGQRGQEMIEFDSSLEPHYGQFFILKERNRRETDWKNCMKAAVDDLVACMGTKKKPKCSLQDAVGTLEVCTSLQSQIQTQN